jgi:hypothetical protein
MQQTLTSWSWPFLEKPPVVQLLNSFPESYGTRRFITMFTRAPLTGPYPEPDQSSPYNPILSKIHFNIIHTPTSLFLVLSVLLVLPPTFIPHSCYMTYPSHPPWLDHSNYTWRRLQVMKLLIMQFSRTSRHPTLGGSLVITAWHVLRLRIEETASRYGG